MAAVAGSEGLPALLQESASVPQRLHPGRPDPLLARAQPSQIPGSVSPESLARPPSLLGSPGQDGTRSHLGIRDKAWAPG